VKKVFVDSGGVRARELLGRAITERWRFVTTNAVVTETCALLLVRTRERRAQAIAFLDGLAATEVKVERVRASDEAHAFALVRAHDDEGYSLCDAYSFVVMQRLRVAHAIAFDRHFREIGKFEVL
jgi:uncharacterized protein